MQEERHEGRRAGNGNGGKTIATKLVAIGHDESCGWPAGSIHDLGDITAARGMKAYLLLWLRLRATFGTPHLNIKVFR